MVEMASPRQVQKPAKNSLAQNQFEGRDYASFDVTNNADKILTTEGADHAVYKSYKPRTLSTTMTAQAFGGGVRMTGLSMNAKLRQKEATKKRLMSAYQIKQSLKENPTLRFNLDLADYSERATAAGGSRTSKNKPTVIQRKLEARKSSTGVAKLPKPDPACDQ